MRSTPNLFRKAALIAGLCMLLPAAGCSDGGNDPEPRSLSYRGHQSNADSDGAVAAYPAIMGTRLDDCQLCHTAGEVTRSGGGTTECNPCTYCHLIPYPDATITVGAPADYAATLNGYGLDYMSAGRDKDAILAIAQEDSDGDLHTNAVEIAALRYPGDAGSKPGLPTIPIHALDWEEITGLAAHTQFLLLNSHKQQFDTYAEYTGVKILDLLAAAGVDPGEATSITCIAPDGFAVDLPIEDVTAAYPPGLYFGGMDPGSYTDPDQGFVEYPPAECIPAGIEQGGEIPGEPWVILAYGRDRLPLDQGYLDPTSGKLDGEGPLRLVVPQRTPGAPDRGSKYCPSGYEDGRDYDSAKDHNAGDCVRAIVAIRVNPLPAGYEEFDWKNGGWALVERKEVIVYGAGVTGD